MRGEISVFALRGMWGAGRNPSLVDVRSATEFASGHIAGAVNVPLPELAARREDLHGESLVLICERGSRARAAQTALLPCHPEALVMDGGMHAWREARLPVVRSTRTTWSLERQVRLGAGTMVLAGIALDFLLGRGWLALAVLPGAGLVLAGLTDFCPLGMFLGRMPWNRMRVAASDSRQVQEATAK